jgi:hypothetical protein
MRQRTAKIFEERRCLGLHQHPRLAAGLPERRIGRRQTEAFQPHRLAAAGRIDADKEELAIIGHED